MFSFSLLLSGYVSGSLNATMHGHFAGGRGPFSPSQWIELEHQALIYKYITANVPVPSNLLMSLKKSLYPFSLTGSSAGSLSSNSCKLLTFSGFVSFVFPYSFFIQSCLHIGASVQCNLKVFFHKQDIPKCKSEFSAVK